MSKSRKKLSQNQKRKAKLAKREVKAKQHEKRLRNKIASQMLVNGIMERFAAMWSPEDIEEMETEEIVEKLNELGIPFDEVVFRTSVPQFYSPARMAEDLWRKEIDLIPGLDGDFPWMATGVLWQRLCPEIANENTILDGIDAGYDTLNEGDVAKACDSWLQVWELLKSRFLENTKTIETVEDRAGDYYSTSLWLLNVIDELANAGEEDPAYLEKRKVLCDEIRTLLPDSPESFLEKVK